MDLRSVLEKLDEIKRQHFLAEMEDLMEKVGLRLADYTAAVRGITDDNQRAAKIGEIARQYNFPGLFDPVSGKFVNAKDGKFAWFGGYEAEVRQLAAKGLIPDAAKTKVWGLMGQDEKIAKPNSQTAEKLYQQIDKADELIKKAIEAPVKEGLAESLLKEFGINTNLLEAITPEEHQLINKTRQDIEPLLKAADGDAVEYKANYENYIRMRNELIAKINALIEAIKKLPAPKTTPAGNTTRQGSAATPANESVSNLEKNLLVELSLTPAGKKANAKIYQPTSTGYLTPAQSQHNINMIKKGYAQYDTSDHIGQNIKDFANSATVGFADKIAAWASSRNDPNTSYDAELLKLRGQTDAYNRSGQATNLRNAVKAVTGYEMSPDNMFGNMTPGDLAGAIATGAGLYNLGAKTVAKFGGGKVAKVVGGTTTGVVAPVAAAMTIGEPDSKVPGTRPVSPQPAKDKNIEAFQREVLKTDKKAFPKYGPDGRMGPEVRGAIDKYPEIAKKYGLGGTSTSTTTTTASAGDQADQVYQGADTSRSDVNQSASQNAVPSGDTTVAQSAPQAGSEQINTQQLQAALAQVGQQGKTITPDQLLALADIMVPDEASAVAPPTLAESSELARILKLSGVSEGVFDALVRGGVKSGADDVARSAASAGTSIFSKGGEELTGAVVKQGTTVWRQQADGYWTATAKNGKKLLKSAEEMGLKQGKKAGKKAQAQDAAKAVDDMVRGSVKSGADDAAKGVAGAVDDAAKGVAGAVDDAAKGVRGAADDVAKNWAYKLGNLGGRFARLVKNNKWLAILAALAALGIYMYSNSNNNDDVRPQPVPPQPPRPNPQPGGEEEERKREEERRRQLGELNELLKRLFGGWPTDAETAQTIQSAVAIGATAPEGFKAGGVATQPASGNQSGAYRSLINQDTQKEYERQAANNVIPQNVVPRSAR